MEDNINKDSVQERLSIEQIAAAIIANKGAITIPISALTESHYGKNIAMFYNEEDKSVTFSMMSPEQLDAIDNAEVEEAPAE
jgi:hypothetical protein